MFLLAGGLAVGIRIERAVRPREPITVETVFSGVTFILSRRVLLAGMSLDLFAVLFRGGTGPLPLYAPDSLSTEPIRRGLLRSAPPVGGLATAVFLALYPLP